MTADYQKYVGSLFAKLVDGIADGVTLRKLPQFGVGFYIVNEHAPIMAKYASSRKGPWSFTFHPAHVENYQKAYQQYGMCIVALVCAMDGVAALKPSQFQQVVSLDTASTASISIARRLNHMYAVSGTAGDLNRRISQNSLVALIKEMCAK